MSDGFDAVNGLFSMLRDAIAAPPKTPPTGHPGLLKIIPDGWASVTYFIRDYTDDTEQYTGPVLSESERYIGIEVWGDPMWFPKNKCVIRRAEQ